MRRCENTHTLNSLAGSTHAQTERKKRLRVQTSHLVRVQGFRPPNQPSWPRPREHLSHYTKNTLSRATTARIGRPSAYLCTRGKCTAHLTITPGSGHTVNRRYDNYECVFAQSSSNGTVRTRVHFWWTGFGYGCVSERVEYDRKYPLSKWTAEIHAANTAAVFEKCMFTI